MKIRFTVAAAAAVGMFAVSPASALTSDHLQCFKIKDDAAKVAYTATLTPTDPTFAAAPGCKLKTPAKLLCVDTVKSAVAPAPPGAPDGDPAQKYLCYKTKCPVSAATFAADDQFGSHNVTILKTGLLCTPVNTVATTTTTLPPGCAVPGDCMGSDNECQARTCMAGSCGISYTPFGNSVMMQAIGDCQRIVCDGTGGTTSVDEPMDPPADDGNQCTFDYCSAGAPIHPAKPLYTPCSQSGGSSCNGSGSCTANCGDGVVSGGELCDDGNFTNGDGCDDGVGGTCKPTACGNGVVTGTEVCDDGNNVNGDGCDNNCTPTACGNGVIAGGEVCDDNNALSSDGCSSSCLQEPGYNCGGEPSVCTGTCGDGFVVVGEGCDQGNLANGDGCSSSCLVELGYQCAGSPSVCTAVCGDGIVISGEGCDDHNNVSGDGCSFSCNQEPGFACSGSPSVCPAICGDGLVRGSEQCDDGLPASGDGCSSTCNTEAGFICSGEPSVCVPL